MKRLLSGAGVGVAALLLAVIPAQGVPAQELAPLTTHSVADGGVPGSYVVTLRPGADPAAVASELGLPLETRYTHVLNGFATTMDSARLYQARTNGDVVAISQDQRYRVDSPPKPDSRAQSAAGRWVPWGLDRLDQAKLPLDHRYRPQFTGTGVTAYVLDTGIARDYPQFHGRASVGFDATGGDGVDRNGDGTHSAGLVGSKTFGVAKQVRIVGVKVLFDNATGTTQNLLQGLDWVAKHAKGPSVANMSFGGPKDPTLNGAAHALVTKYNVFLAAAAEDTRDDADHVSPASTDGVFTVAASNRHDQAMRSSNYGWRVEAYAPGLGVRSTVPGGKTALRDGTAPATPYATGAAALYLQSHPEAGAQDILAGLRSAAAQGVVHRVPEDTTTNLLQVAGR